MGDALPNRSGVGPKQVAIDGRKQGPKATVPFDEASLQVTTGAAALNKPAHLGPRTGEFLAVPPIKNVSH
jgi:hypothetical protein